MPGGRPKGSKESAAAKTAKAARKHKAEAEAQRQGRANLEKAFKSHTRSTASTAPASSSTSSSSSAAASSSSASSASDGTPPAPPLLIAGSDGAGAGLADIHMAVENEQALGDLHAQRAELAEQQSAVLEQAPAPA